MLIAALFSLTDAIAVSGGFSLLALLRSLSSPDWLWTIRGTVGAGFITAILVYAFYARRYKH